MGKRIAIAVCVLAIGAIANASVIWSSNPVADVHVYMTNVNTNYGLDPNLRVRFGTPPDVYKVYMEFDLPTDVWTINSATLRLSTAAATKNDGKNTQLWGMGESYDDWVETTITWTTSVASNGNDPATAGFVVGTASQLTNNMPWVNGQLTVTFDLVASQSSPGALQTLIQNDTDKKITFGFYGASTTWYKSKDFATIDNRPLLTLDYDVPEPATLSVLALGLGGLLIRRKRS